MTRGHRTTKGIKAMIEPLDGATIPRRLKPALHGPWWRRLLCAIGWHDWVSTFQPLDEHMAAHAPRGAPIPMRELKVCKWCLGTDEEDAIGVAD